MEEIVKELNTITRTRPDHKHWKLDDLTRYKWKNSERFARNWESLMEDADCYPNASMSEDASLCEHCRLVLTRRIKDIYGVDICDVRLKLQELCDHLDVIESKIQTFSAQIEQLESRLKA